MRFQNLKTLSMGVGAVMTAGWACEAPAAVLTYSGANTTNADRWNTATNWTADSGPQKVPSDSDSVIVPSGKIATAWSAATPTYTGNLTVNGTLQLGWTTVINESYNALGTPGQTVITMGAGALIKSRSGGTPVIPAVTLNGAATIRLGESTQTPANADFNYPITGNYQLLLEANANGAIDLNATSSFAALVFNTLNGRGGNAGTLSANKTGALGSGDVTINSTGTESNAANSFRSYTLVFNDTVNGNAMADTAVLYYEGAGPAANQTGANKVQMLASETIGGLFLDGVEQAPGTYGRIGLAGVDFNVPWISSTGNGILTVIPEPASLVLAGLGGLLIAARRRA